MHSSKSGRSAFAHIVRLDVIELLSTDQLPEPDLRDALAAAEVEIVIAAGLSRLCVTGECARPADRARARRRDALIAAVGPVIAMPLADLERRRLRMVELRFPVPSCHRKAEPAGPVAWLRARYTEQAAWRQVGYSCLLAPAVSSSRRAARIGPAHMSYLGFRQTA